VFGKKHSRRLLVDTMLLGYPTPAIFVYQAIEPDGHSAEFKIALHDPVRYEFQRPPGVSFANARVAPNSVSKHT
jgi:hypothetical protein